MTTVEALDEALPSGARLAGTFDPAFAGVAEAFVQNFKAHGEIGASVCVTVAGRTVVDLWGGAADPKSGRAWDRDTIVPVFSCTKGAAALCAHLLVEEGRLAYEMDVADLWPGFAQHGKAGTTLEMMLAHTAPVPHFRAHLPDGATLDWDGMIARVETEPAWWEPGTRQGYHGLSYAWTVGNMVRLAAGEPLGAFFRRRIAEPLGIDFHIGLPASAAARVARVVPHDGPMLDTRFFRAVRRDPTSLAHLFMVNTGGLKVNRPETHAAEIASMNGITNARGLAGLYASLTDGAFGLLPPERIDRMARVCAATHDDAALLQPMRFGLGFMASIDGTAQGAESIVIGRDAFGHDGMGGSVGFADPQAGMSFGYAMNQLGPGLLLDVRAQSQIDAAYRALGWRSRAGGAWLA